MKQPLALARRREKRRIHSHAHSSPSQSSISGSSLSPPATMDQLLVVESSDMMFRKNAL